MKTTIVGLYRDYICCLGPGNLKLQGSGCSALSVSPK